ncbi:hypothetical protein L1887_25378 [Cichorium endivia]|nr:hypothetical protein L1887_25378 [Cichorium endivia]
MRRYNQQFSVDDTETRRRAPPRTPPTTTAVSRIVMTEIRPVNLDRQVVAGHSIYDIGDVVKEQIYDNSTCKNNNCVICIEKFKEKETIKVVVSCQHSFHAHCINDWLRVNRSCPICRKPIAS